MTNHSRFSMVAIAIGANLAPPLVAVALSRLAGLQWLRIDWSDPVRWLRWASPETVLAAALLRIASMACIGLTIASVAYMTGRLAGLPRLVRALSPMTPAIVRSIADRVVVGAVAVSSLGVAPPIALASDRPPVSAPAEPIPARIDSDRAAMTVRADFLPFDHRGAPSAGHGRVTVRAGDTLWAIAEAHLLSALDRTPTGGEITRHWHRMIELNRPMLRSGDPDLIHPGETVSLPPLDL